MNATELRAAISLAFIYVFRMLGLFMVMPVIAVMATDYENYSIFLVGLAIGGYGLTQAFLQIPMGMLSDKFGRKPIIMLGLLMFCAGSIVAALADDMWWLIIGRVLQGAGAIAGAIMALAADVSRENQRAKVMAIIGIAIGFSFYLALLLGPIIGNNFGLSGIFAVTAVFAVICMPLLWWVVPNANNYAPSGDTLPKLTDLTAMIKNPQLLRLNVSVCLLHLMITLLFVQLPSMFVTAGMDLDKHWQLYLPILLLSIIGLAGLMSINRKHSGNLVLIVAVLLLVAAFSGFASFNGLWTLAICAVIFFTGFNYLEANFPAMVSNIAPAGKKGSAMGMYASFQFFGAFAGGLISGLLNQYFLPHLVFVVAILICLAWLVLLVGLNGNDQLKRYTLSAKVTIQQHPELKHKLAKLQGVHDITIVPEQQAVYLKVDTKLFDLRQAQQIVRTEFS
ncbi:MFS transporter [Aliiglaciecola sp. LCG003]|uniref:MFS transporter n=1 Tax=Aliiglaciecola sp. LCG003 TaxID=3053655 RepID=UPI0025736CE2|nr:MFS transporter [Aliiglaciecola sp. LCG003]WJG09680.1 MFS transporter [Aliiglaciecola sp. LCG003]